MKVVFDLDDKLIVTEAQELIGQEGEITIIDSRHTYYIENLSEERAKKLVMEAYNSKCMNLTGFITKVRD